MKSLKNSEIKNVKFKEGLPIEFEVTSISKIIEKHKCLISISHRTEFYHIIWIQKGRPKHFIDFKPYVLKPDSILFIPKYCINAFDTVTNFEERIILFTDDFFCKNPNDITFLKSTLLFNNINGIINLSLNEKNKELKKLFELMENEYEKQNDFAHSDLLRNYLHNFLLIAEREISKAGLNELIPSTNAEYFLNFRDLLEENFKKHRTVRFYSDNINISEKRLYLATKNLLNKTPKQLIDERMLLEAKRFLINRSINVKEIAFELGFEELTYFIKFFRKHTKQTPVEFRKNYQSM